MRLSWLTYIIFAMLVGGCTSTGERVEIRRLDHLASEASDGGLQIDSMRGFFPGVKALMKIVHADSTAGEIDFLAQYGAAGFSNAFGPEVERLLPSLTIQENELAEARTNLAGILPDLKFPSEIYGILTPYTQSVMMVDTVMLIGLNHYLGSDFEGYASFGASRSRKIPERLSVEAVSALIMSKYPFVAEYGGASLLQMMLYNGAVTMAVKEVLPAKDFPRILGISREDASRLKEEEKEIWRALAEKGLLFSSDEGMSMRLMLPSVNSDAIYPGCPGMAAQYIGMRIVESYMNNHPDTPISYLLSPEFYNSQDVLRDSKYK